MPICAQPRAEPLPNAKPSLGRPIRGVSDAKSTGALTIYLVSNHGMACLPHALLLVPLLAQSSASYHLPLLFSGKPPPITNFHPCAPTARANIVFIYQSNTLAR